MGDLKITAECFQTTEKDYGKMVEGAGGNDAPTEILEINNRLWETFECRDHFVALEKRGDEYYYVHRWRHGESSMGPKIVAPFDLSRPPFIKDGFLILGEDPEKTSFLVLPADNLGPFINKEALQAFYLQNFLVDLTGESLIKDFRLTPIGLGERVYRLEIEFPKEIKLEDISPKAVSPSKISLKISQPPAKKPPEKKDAWEFQLPWDQTLIDGMRGMRVDPRGFSERPFNIFRLGLGWKKENAALETGIEFFQDREKTGLGGFVGLRSPDRPFFRSGLHLFKDLEEKGDFSPPHFEQQIAWPGLPMPFFSSQFLVWQPFISADHGFGENEFRLSIGLRVASSRSEELDPEVPTWDSKRISLLTADTLLLGLSAASLALTMGDLLQSVGKPADKDAANPDPGSFDQRFYLLDSNTRQTENVSYGVGFYAGQMAYLDSIFLEAAQKKKVASWIPMVHVISKWTAGAIFLLPEIEDSPRNPSGMEFLGHALLLDASLGTLQKGASISPDNPWWILGNTLAGSLLLIYQARKDEENPEWAQDYNSVYNSRLALKETRGDAHRVLAGTALLSYGINLLLHYYGWDN